MKFITKLNEKNEIIHTPYIRHHLSKFKNAPHIIVTVDKPSNKRSIPQNKYYWLVLGVISGHTGHTEDELHKLFKGMFLPRKEIELNGKKYNLASSTTDLTVGQFVEYIMRITAEAGDMGISIPSIEDFKKGLDVPDFIV